MSSYYNEIDPQAAAWLRELISQGLIAPGDVDERSIEDVKPEEIKDYTQCHFFAGIGTWSYALRQAGWPDDQPVWTGSCPCQPFSTAGKGKGFADERHLWPAFHWLIEKCKPGVVFGEQVAGKAGETWLDLVSTDLEVGGYTIGSAVTAACGFGAPHLRRRLYWVADSNSDGPRGNGRGFSRTEGGSGHPPISNGSEFRGGARSVAHRGATGRLFPVGDLAAINGSGSRGGRSPTNGKWRDADWIKCRDGGWRAVEPGSFPLVDGVATRLGRLRGYGNSLVAPQAQAFIEAHMGV